ncbi:MAG: hypothetical protein ACLSAH_06035 [Bilophila wadsworthia]
MKTFIKRRSAFFHIDPYWAIRASRTRPAASPDGLALARLLQGTLPQCENVFAQLARLERPAPRPRRGRSQGRGGYATILLALQEAR